jgi:hypothetical protein
MWGLRLKPCLTISIRTLADVRRSFGTGHFAARCHARAEFQSARNTAQFKAPLGFSSSNLRSLTTSALSDPVCSSSSSRA